MRKWKKKKKKKRRGGGRVAVESLWEGWFEVGQKKSGRVVEREKMGSRRQGRRERIMKNKKKNKNKKGKK